MSNGLEVTMTDVRRAIREAGVTSYPQSAEVTYKAVFDSGVAHASRYFAQKIVDLQQQLDAREQEFNQLSPDLNRLVRELDVAVNGPENAAKQASLVDVVRQLQRAVGDSNVVDLLQRTDHGFDRSSLANALNELRSAFGVPFEFPHPDTGRIVSGLMYPNQPAVASVIGLLEAMLNG